MFAALIQSYFYFAKLNENPNPINACKYYDFK